MEHLKFKKFSAHKFTLYEESLSETTSALECTLHKTHTLSAFCLSCKTVACSECLFDSHNGHSIARLQEEADRCRKKLSAEAQEFETRNQNKTRALEIAKQETALIHATAQKKEAQVQQKISALIEELSAMQAKLCQELEQEKDRKLKMQRLYVEDLQFELNARTGGIAAAHQLVQEGISNAAVVMGYGPLQARFDTLRKWTTACSKPSHTFTEMPQLELVPSQSKVISSLSSPAPENFLFKPALVNFKGHFEGVTRCPQLGSFTTLFRKALICEYNDQIVVFDLSSYKAHVLKLEPTLKIVDQWKFYANEVSPYVDVVYDGDYFYFLSQEGSILVLDTKGFIYNVWGVQGVDAGALANPLGLYLGQNDQIFILDGFGKKRIQAFDKKGLYLGAFTLNSGSPCQFKFLSDSTIIVRSATFLWAIKGGKRLWEIPCSDVFDMKVDSKDTIALFHDNSFTLVDKLGKRIGSKQLGGDPTKQYCFSVCIDSQGQPVLFDGLNFRILK